MPRALSIEPQLAPWQVANEFAALTGPLPWRCCGLLPDVSENLPEPRVEFAESKISLDLMRNALGH